MVRICCTAQVGDVDVGQAGRRQLSRERVRTDRRQRSGHPAARPQAGSTGVGSVGGTPQGGYASRQNTGSADRVRAVARTAWTVRNIVRLVRPEPCTTKMLHPYLVLLGLIQG